MPHLWSCFCLVCVWCVGLFGFCLFAFVLTVSFAFLGIVIIPYGYSALHLHNFFGSSSHQNAEFILH